MVLSPSATSENQNDGTFEILSYTSNDGQILCGTMTKNGGSLVNNGIYRDWTYQNWDHGSFVEVSNAEETLVYLGPTDGTGWMITLDSTVMVMFYQLDDSPVILPEQFNAPITGAVIFELATPAPDTPILLSNNFTVSGTGTLDIGSKQEGSEQSSFKIDGTIEVNEGGYLTVGNAIITEGIRINGNGQTTVNLNQCTITSTNGIPLIASNAFVTLYDCHITGGDHAVQLTGTILELASIYDDIGDIGNVLEANSYAIQLEDPASTVNFKGLLKITTGKDVISDSTKITNLPSAPTKTENGYDIYEALAS